RADYALVCRSPPQWQPPPIICHVDVGLEHRRASVRERCSRNLRVTRDRDLRQHIERETVAATRLDPRSPPARVCAIGVRLAPGAFPSNRLSLPMSGDHASEVGNLIKLRAVMFVGPAEEAIGTD